MLMNNIFNIENDRNKSFQKSSSLKEMYMDDWMDMLADKGHKQGVQVQWAFFSTAII